MSRTWTWTCPAGMRRSGLALRPPGCVPGVRATDDAVHYRMTTIAVTADVTPAGHHARLNVLAEQSVRAAETYEAALPAA